MRPGQFSEAEIWHAVPYHQSEQRPAARRPDRRRHQATDRRSASAARHQAAVDPQLRRNLQCQPLHGGRGLRPPGRDGLSAVAPRRRLLHGGRTRAGGVATHPAPSDNHKRNEELVWLIRRLLEADENTILAGGPWLPNSWLDEAGIRQSLNVLARKNGAYLLEYGHPFGYLPLREHLALMLAGLGITAQSRPDPADAGHQPGARTRHPLSAQARRRGAGGRSRLLQHVRQSAPAGRRDAGGAAQSRRTGRRHSRKARRCPPAEGLFHPVGDAEPDRNRHEPACGVQGAAGRRAPQLHGRGG